MKAIALVTALAGVASAHTHLARQADDNSTECQQASDALVSAGIPQPTALRDLSVSYYETAARTESKTIFECDWVTEIPESAYPTVAEFFAEQTAWIGAAGNLDLLYDNRDKCGTSFIDGITHVHGLTPEECFECTPYFDPICYSEWSDTSPKILEALGWDSYGRDGDTDVDDGDVDDADASDTDADKPNMASAGFQTSAVAVLLATLLGAVALL